MFCILYRFLAALARLSVRSGRSKDLEILVLRHQLHLLRRQIDRAELNDGDRTLLGAVSAALPRRLRHGWIVTPETLLRWHRQSIARHWTQPPTRRPGGPPTAIELRQLVTGHTAHSASTRRSRTPTLRPRHRRPSRYCEPPDATA